MKDLNTDAINTDTVNQRIEEFLKLGKTPSKLEIGFKTYARLVEDDQFYVHVTKSDDSKSRMYKGIKIKLVTEKYHLKLK